MAAVLVTGANSGIGLATARYLAGRGDRVVAGVRDLARSRPLEELRGQGLAVSIVPLDVTSDASVVGAVDRAVEWAGRLDAVVNNAGVALFAPVEETTGAELRDVLDVNLIGSLRVIQAALPHLRAAGGVVVNISSVNGRVAMPALGAYSASKHALEALSEALWYELAGSGVRIVLVQPGIFKTPIDGNARVTPGGHPMATARRALAESSPPLDVVAGAVARAVDDPSTPFRMPVGPDAEMLLAARSASDDPTFMAMLASMLTGAASARV